MASGGGQPTSKVRPVQAPRRESMRACMHRLPDQLLLAGMLGAIRELLRLCSARFRSEMLLGSSAERLQRTT